MLYWEVQLCKPLEYSKERQNRKLAVGKERHSKPCLAKTQVAKGKALATGPFKEQKVK